MYYYQVISNKVDKISRYFRRNKGTDDYATIPAVTLAGSVVIEFDILTSKDAIQYIFDNSVNSDRVYAYYDNGASEIKTSLTSASISVDGGGNTITHDGLLHHVVITGNASGKIVNLMTNNAATFKLQGILANLKIWDNGTLIRDYPLDESKGTDIIVNRATTLGANLSTSNDPLDSVLIGGSGFSFYDLGSVVEGERYLASCEISNYIGSGSVGLRSTLGIADGISPRNRFSNGKIELLFTATGSGVVGLYTQASNQCTFSNISVRQADGYGAIINGNDEDKGLFTQQANGDWLGQNMWTFGDAISNGAEGTYTAIIGVGSGILTSNTLYKCSGTVVGLTAGQLWLQIGGNYHIASVNGDFSVDVDSAAHTGLRVITGASQANVGATISDISVKEVLKKA